MQSQADKSGETQRRVVEAAVKCLHTRGYGAVSTELVLIEAGVSRGALLHQFPTRTDLMLAVVKAVFDEEERLYAERLAQTDDPLERLLALPELVFEMSSRPGGIAVIEILLASRSDPALSEALGPLQANLTRDLGARAQQSVRDAGLPITTEGPLIRRMLIAAARGLAVDMIFSQDRESVLETARFLRTTLERHFAAEIAQAKARAGEP